MTDAPKHAKLSPSSAHRWLVCTGSVEAQARHPEQPTSVFAAEGTAAHYLAEMCLGADQHPSDFLQEEFEVEGFHFQVDDEMVDAVGVYLDMLETECDGADEVGSEARIDMQHLAPGMFGTVDRYAYFRETRTLKVFDLKYGKGVEVDAKNNKQLMTYAAGLAPRFHNQGLDTIELFICQPRVRREPSKWECTYAELQAHAVAIGAAAERIRTGDTTRVAGRHCKWCKDAPWCETLRDRVLDITNGRYRKGRIVPTDPNNLDSQQLALALENAAIVKTWMGEVQSRALAEALSGNPPPGWKLVQKRTNRKWKDEDEALSLLSSFIDAKKLVKTEMLSPAQAQAVLPKGAKEAVELLSHKPPGEASLAPEDDPRPAISGAEATGFEPVEV